MSSLQITLFFVDKIGMGRVEISNSTGKSLVWKNLMKLYIGVKLFYIRDIAS